MLASYLARFGATLLGSTQRSRLSALEEARMPMRVWPTDVDVYRHLNNGRFFTLMDFGRLDHVLRTGLFTAGVKQGWRPVASAASVRFRRELALFARFELVTRICFWDRKYLYYEHRFERREDVHAVAYVQTVTKRQGRTVTPVELLEAVGFAGAPPTPGPELAGWIRALTPLRVAAEKSPA